MSDKYQIDLNKIDKLANLAIKVRFRTSKRSKFNNSGKKINLLNSLFCKFFY